MGHGDPQSQAGPALQPRVCRGARPGHRAAARLPAVQASHRSSRSDRRDQDARLRPGQSSLTRRSGRRRAEQGIPGRDQVLLHLERSPARLFDSHIQGVPYAERNIEGPADVVDAAVSDDVGREWRGTPFDGSGKRSWSGSPICLPGTAPSSRPPSTSASSAGSRGHWKTPSPTPRTLSACCPDRSRVQGTAGLVDAVPGLGAVVPGRSSANRTWSAPRGCRATSC